jgi:hypothetical protein
LRATRCFSSGFSMADIAYLGLALATFAILALGVIFCERL